MLPRYLGSFLVVLAVICGGLSTLKFATRSVVRAGTEVHETWTNEFTIDARQDWKKHYPVDDALKSDLENGVAFLGTGVVQVRSYAVRITPKTVSWSRNKTSYKAPGGQMIADLIWSTPADAPDGARGDIRIRFPSLRTVPSYTFAIHSNGRQRGADGRYVYREAAAYRTESSLMLGRMLYVFSVALPMTMLLHSLWWGLRLKREGKLRIAELQPSDPESLPRVFYPNPLAEWAGWTFTIAIFGGIGSLLGCIAIFNEFLFRDMDRALLVIESIGLAIALIVALIIRRSVVTVRIDAHGIGYARGRQSEPDWITARWSELRRAEFKSRTYKGRTTRWLELGFPDGKTRKIPSNVIDFPELQSAVLERYAKHH